MQSRPLSVAPLGLLFALMSAGCGDDAMGPGDAAVGSGDAAPSPDGRPAGDGGSPDMAAADPCAPGQPGVFELDAADAPFVAIAGTQAPATVHLHALTDTLGTPSRDILASHYEWTFGDAAGGHDRIVGWSAAHVYLEPGDYCATLRVTDPDGMVTVVRVRVPVAPSTRSPIHVSPDGDDGADGLTPSTAVQSVARAAELLAEEADRDVLFERGRTHPIPEGPIAFGDREESVFDTRGTNVRFASYGDAPERPLLLWSAASNRTFLQVTGDARNDSGARDVTVEGLAFDQTEAPIDRSRRPTTVYAAGVNVTLRDNEVRNVLTFVNAQAGDQGDGPRTATRALRGLLLQDNVATTSTSVLMYFAWMQGEDFAALGNTAPNSVEEHIFRGSPIRAIFAYNTVSNEDRRFRDIETGDICPRCDGAAGCNRFTAPAGCECTRADGCDELDFSKGVFVLRGDYNYAFANDVPVGPAVVEPLCPYEETAHRVSEYAAFDSNWMHAGTMVVHANHAVVRNNWIDCVGDACLRISRPALCATNDIGDIRFHHNTARQSGNAGRVLWFSHADDVEAVNNLAILEPGRPCIEYGTHALSMGDFSAEFRGNVWSLNRDDAARCFHHGDRDLSHADWVSLGTVSDDALAPVALESDGRPTPAVPGATRPAGAVFDRLGAVRPERPTAGAQEEGS